MIGWLEVPFSHCKHETTAGSYQIIFSMIPGLNAGDFMGAHHVLESGIYASNIEIVVYISQSRIKTPRTKSEVRAKTQN